MYSDTSASLCVQLDHSSQVSLDLATTQGASAWLSALSEYGSTFHVTIGLHYVWPLHRTPHCVCGTVFSVDHTLSCPKGSSFPSSQ